MFDGVSFSDNVLLFHTSASAGQSGAVTTLRQGSVKFTNYTISLASMARLLCLPRYGMPRSFSICLRSMTA